MVGTSLTVFNNQVENFIRDLLKILPDNRDIKVFNEKFKLIKGSNPRLTIESFLMYIYPYQKYIMDKDERYFLSDDLDKELSGNTKLLEESGADSEYVLTKSLGLKELWTNELNQEQKEVIWKYFQVMIKLCERYVCENMNK